MNAPTAPRLSDLSYRCVELCLCFAIQAKLIGEVSKLVDDNHHWNKRLWLRFVVRDDVSTASVIKNGRARQYLFLHGALKHRNRIGRVIDHRSALQMPQAP